MSYHRNKINLILAKSKNGVIGKDNSMPWYIPEELAFFKKETLNKVIIMGKNTFNSLGGKPLPNRVNVVISTTLTIDDFNGENFVLFKTLEEALTHYHREIYLNEVFLIGGAKLSKYALEKEYIKTIFETEVEIEIKGDNLTYAPAFDAEDYVMLHLLTQVSSTAPNLQFSVYEYIKVKFSLT